MADRMTHSLPPREHRGDPVGVCVEIATGPHAGQSVSLQPGERVFVGTREDCGLRVDDRAVSRQHLEVACEPFGVVLTDLESKNGSWIGANRFTKITVRPPLAVRVGGIDVRIYPLPDPSLARFGALVAKSLAMRAVFSMLARVAASDVPVLVRGETGTGKELAARAIHDASARRGQPYVVVDLAAIAPQMLESELFGHRRGAFTGAVEDRAGAFEAAGDGTVFLDEIGELEVSAQPRLLRVLETGETKRLGSNTFQRTRARVVAATNRDLAAEISARRFRDDLYHRIAGITIEMPPLRNRPEDIPILVDHFVSQFSAALQPVQISDDTMDAMMRYDWPGNARQLRKVLERAAVLAAGSEITPGLLGLDMTETEPVVAPAVAVSDLPFKEAKQQLVDAWEREYLDRLVATAGGNITRAAELAGIARVHLHRLLKKHGYAT